MRRFEGQAVVVTGSATGIGEATARRFGWIANKTQMLNSNLMVLLPTSSAKLLADDVEYSVVQTLRVVTAKDSGIP